MERINTNLCNFPMPRASILTLALTLTGLLEAALVWGQVFPPSDSVPSGLRPVQSGSSGSGPVMVPLSGAGPMAFDPYAVNSTSMGGAGLGNTPPFLPATSLPPQPFGNTGFSNTGFGNTGFGNSFNANPAPPAGGLFGSGPSWMGPTAFPQQGVPGGMQPGGVLPGGMQPGGMQPGGFMQNPGFATTPGQFPNTTPSALYPGNFGGMGVAPSPWAGQWGSGYNWNPQGTLWGGGFGQNPQYVRLCQGFRVRNTYLDSDRGTNALRINDLDLALGLVYPNFLFSTQPLFLLPTFSYHTWSGFNPENNADLPTEAYSAFLDAGWQSDPTAIFGAELGVRVGMFSAFDANSSDSLRILGRGIGRVRLTPQTALRLGVLYLDRNRVKLLPAAGILWQPSPFTRLDIFFPEPKLSSYLTTIGNLDSWWYVAGYYGGGSWTVRRDNGQRDSIDINDIRIVIGLEWGRNDLIREGRRCGFAELGVVFERELLYKHNPQDNLDLKNTFVVRVGYGY